jgi:hypothetical protein
VSAVCDLLVDIDVPVYAVRDFDKAGFSIVSALQRGTRGSRTAPAHVIDLGLRLADIEGLEREEVSYPQQEWPGTNLLENGATEEEVEVLVSHRTGHLRGWAGERVELNAMTSPELMAFIESKLKEHKVEKIVPQDVIIQARARYLLESEFADAAVAKLRSKIQEQAAAAVLPADLRHQIEADFVKVPTGAWDHALAAIVAKLASEAKKRKR